MLKLENRLFTFEEGLWNIRGRYEKAFEENDELLWSNINGEYTTHILIVSLSFSFFFFCNILFRILLGTLMSLWQHLFVHLRLISLPLFLVLGGPPISIISSS
jgi:hypothetical protein